MRLIYITPWITATTLTITDALTTNKALSLGATEINPLMKPFTDAGLLYPTTAIIICIYYYFSKTLRKDRHPSMTIWTIFTIITLVRLAATINNWNVIQTLT